MSANTGSTEKLHSIIWKELKIVDTDNNAGYSQLSICYYVSFDCIVNGFSFSGEKHPLIFANNEEITADKIKAQLADDVMKVYKVRKELEDRIQRIKDLNAELQEGLN